MIVAVCLLVVAVALLLWCFIMPEGGGETRTIVVQVIHSDSSTRDFTLKTEAANLGEALVEGGVVEDNQQIYGLYILTADGETVDESRQEWWMLTKDGEMLNTGADSTPIANGEHYELTFTVGYDT